MQHLPPRQVPLRQWLSRWQISPSPLSHAPELCFVKVASHASQSAPVWPNGHLVQQPVPVAQAAQNRWPATVAPQQKPARHIPVEHCSSTVQLRPAFKRHCVPFLPLTASCCRGCRRRPWRAWCVRERARAGGRACGAHKRGRQQETVSTWHRIFNLLDSVTDVFKTCNRRNKSPFSQGNAAQARTGKSQVALAATYVRVFAHVARGAVEPVRARLAPPRRRAVVRAGETSWHTGDASVAAYAALAQPTRTARVSELQGTCRARVCVACFAGLFQALALRRAVDELVFLQVWRVCGGVNSGLCVCV